MSNDDLPGFIEDEPKKPGKPAPAAPAKGFNAFSDVPVKMDSPAAAAPAPAAKAAAPKAAAPAAKPGTGRTAKPAAPAAAAAPAKGFDAFADAANTPDGNDADVKPGTGRDLWSCPHCGTKNKPERTTCRSCSKSPDDEVIVLWHQKPMVKPAIGAGAVLVIVLLGWLLLGGGVRLVEAEDRYIDSAPRTGGGAGAASDLDGNAFTPSKRYGVCGRMVGANTKGSLTVLVLALGKDGTDPARANEAGVDFSGSEPVVTPELRTAVVTCFGKLPPLDKGRVVSLLGDIGSLAGTDGQVLRVELSAPLP